MRSGGAVYQTAEVLSPDSVAGTSAVDDPEHPLDIERRVHDVLAMTLNPVNPFHDYLAEHLDELLRKRSVVVFYDPRNEFTPFFDRELEPRDGEPLLRVTIGARATFLARHEGSFFGLRAAVEPIVAADKPEPVLSSGTGKLKPAGGVSGEMKESVNRAFSYLSANKTPFGVP